MNSVFSPKQLLFQELFVGTLIYAVVLGFFDDYTQIVTAQSFSTVFLAGFILEILTYLTFRLKTMVVSRIRERPGKTNGILLALSIWLVMFLSKFVFVWALDVVFGESINIEGFFGILAIVLLVTIVHKSAYIVFRYLGRGYNPIAS